MGAQPTPDGVWIWFIAIASSLSISLTAGFYKSSTIFYAELLSRYGSSAAATGLVLSLEAAFKTMTSPLVGALCYRFGLRKVAMLGGLAIAVGNILTGMVPTIYWTYFTFGILKGGGANMFIISRLTIVNAYFDRSKGKANAVSSAILSLGCLYAAPLMTYLFSEYGFGGTLLIVGGVSLHALPAASLFWPYSTRQKASPAQNVTQRHETAESPSDPSKSRGDHHSVSRHETVNEPNTGLQNIPPQYEEGDGTGAEGKLLQETYDRGLGTNLPESSVQEIDMVDPGKESPQGHEVRYIRKAESARRKVLRGCIAKLGLTALADPQLALLTMFMTCWTFNALTCQTLIAGLCHQRNISLQQVSWMISIFCGIEIGTRILGGVVFDLPLVRVHRTSVLSSLGLLVATLTATLPFAQSLPVIMPLWISTQLASGLIMSQEPTVLSDIVPKEKLIASISVVRFFKGIGALAAPFIGGLLFDKLHSYALAYHLSGGLFFLISATFLIGISVGKHQKKMRKGPVKEESRITTQL